MARQINRLTDRQVRTLSEPGRHADGDGLYLVIDPSGAKRWLLRISHHGRRRDLGLGGLRDVTLKEAREKAAEARRVTKAGGDAANPPRRDEPPPLFKDAARTLIDAQSDSWRGRDTKAHWERSLLIYAKALANKTVDQVTTEDVVDVVLPYWRSRAETGRKLRQRIEAVLDAQIAAGKREGPNPARLKGHLDKLLPKQSRKVKHRRAVHYAKAPAVMADLAQHTASSARAMEWTILTAGRESMTLLARWREIDGDVWTLPADRMKDDEQGDFAIPLSVQALAILDDVRLGEPGPDDLIFPGAKPGRPMSDQTMDKLLASMGVDATPHGFRSTFRDWAGEETDHAWEVVEMALAHKVGSGTVRAYRRMSAFAKRRVLMQEWADYVRPRPAEEASLAPNEE